MIYLASPYSDPDFCIRVRRFEAVCKAAAHLMERGHLVFCPTAHTHPIAVAGNLPTGWDYWERYDRYMIERCSEVVVYRFLGWRESKGVQAEIRLAIEYGKTVRAMKSCSFEIVPWETPDEV